MESKFELNTFSILFYLKKVERKWILHRNKQKMGREPKQQPRCNYKTVQQPKRVTKPARMSH
jgi:hypothetical protein